MKQQTIILIAIVALLTACTSKPDITGKWLNVSKPEEGMVFEKDGFLYIFEDNNMKGGENIEMEGQLCQLKYEINYDKKPIWLDLVTIDKATNKEAKRVFGIINIIDENTIEAMITKEGRPIEIDTKNADYIRLKRAK